MADTELENPLGVVDRRRTQGSNSHPLSAGSNGQNYLDVETLRATLAGASAYYTSARLNEMTKNDMVYALRLIGDAGGF